MPEIIAHRCKLSECTVATTDKCIEGLELSVCPNHLGAEAEAESKYIEKNSEAESVQAEKHDETEMVNLPDGLDLTPATASRITRARLTHVVVIAGDQDAGKTTLLASLYDRFQEGSFGGFLFAGCDTLPGLERRCFPSRLLSERVHPDTIRTPRGDGQSLLHLRLRKQDLSRATQDLLLSDISGEFFRDACDSTDGCQQLKILRRADHLALCLDGEKLASSGLRHEAIQTSKLLLQSALDAEMIGRRTFVDVLITKRDLLGPPGPSTALEFLNRLRRGLKSEFEHRFGRLRFFEVAARSRVAQFPLAYGLERILPSWIEDTPLYAQPEPIDQRSLASSVVRTEFDRYLLRRLMR